MPEFPPIQLYAILAIAVTIASIFSAFIREPTTTFVSSEKKKVLLGLLGFYIGAWGNVVGLVCYLLGCVSWQMLSLDESPAVHIFHLGVLAVGLYMSTLIFKEMWNYHISGSVSGP